MRVSIKSSKSKNVFGHSAHLIAVFRITVNFIHLAGVERVKLPSSGLESLILITVLYPYFYLNNFILSIPAAVGERAALRGAGAPRGPPSAALWGPRRNPGRW